MERVIGMKSGKLMGISVMYNFKLDLDMGKEMIAMRRIPCVCNGYLDQLDSVRKTGHIDEEQRECKTSNKCEMKSIFNELNDWQVIKLETSKNDDIDEDDLAKKILHGIESRMFEKIIKVNYGEMRTDNPDTDGYYVFEWSSYVYTTQDDIVMKGYNSSEYAYTSEMVCKTRFWDPVIKAKYWYTPITEGEGDTILKMKQVLMTDIKLEKISEYIKLSKG